MRIVITGAQGFIGRNLAVRLRELGHADVVAVTRDTTSDQLATAVRGAGFVFHLAGVNRPKEQADYEPGNVGPTAALCAALAAQGCTAPIAFASSSQAELDNAYGRSKRAAEEVLLAHGRATGAPVHLYRLPNVFGKWSRPQYNSVVATFAHQIGRGLPITMHDETTRLRLVYVDDVVAAFVALLDGASAPGGRQRVEPEYEITLGELARTLQGFMDSRHSLVTRRVGTGLERALYATFVSHLPEAAFAYAVPTHADARGEFVEMLKTPDCGQFSYFTARPGVTRGGHYHHTKTEKFLVLKGTARFGFRHIQDGRTHELVTRGGEPMIVESIPGWSHDVTNIGDDDLIVMLWANEIFDRARPDTVAAQVRA